jgi:hypothetical protein
MYFGNIGGPGHRLYDEQLRSIHDEKYRQLTHFDGLLPPRDSNAPYIASFSRLGGWGLSAIAFWGYSVDGRDGCNNVIFAPSLTITVKEMLMEAQKRFQPIFSRLPQEVQLHRQHCYEEYVMEKFPSINWDNPDEVQRLINSQGGEVFRTTMPL